MHFTFYNRNDHSNVHHDTRKCMQIVQQRYLACCTPSGSNMAQDGNASRRRSSNWELGDTQDAVPTSSCGAFLTCVSVVVAGASPADFSLCSRNHFSRPGTSYIARLAIRMRTIGIFGQRLTRAMLLAIDRSVMNWGIRPPAELVVAMRHSTLPSSSSRTRSTLA